MPGIFYQTTIQQYLDWPKANYDNPEQRTWLGPFAIVWQVIASFFVFGRLYLRLRNRSVTFSWDDFFILIAWMFSVAFTVVTCVMVYSHELGRNAWDLHMENWSPLFMYGWLAQLLFLHGTCATKVSILLFYARLMRNTYNKIWLWTVWTLLGLTVGLWISMFVAYCCMCTPLDDVWLYPWKELGGQETFNCINGSAMVIAVGVVTIASDFWSAALPCTLFQYHDLGVTKRQKIAMNIIFCLGFIVTGVGIARTYFYWRINHDSDTSWIGYDLCTAAVVELQLAIMCTCAPFLRAFFRAVFPSTFSRGNSYNTASLPTARETKYMDPSPEETTALPQRPQRQWSPTRHGKPRLGALVRDDRTGRLGFSANGGGIPNLLKRDPAEYA